MGGEGGNTEGGDDHQCSTAENRNPHVTVTDGVLRLTINDYKPSHFSLTVLYGIEFLVNYKNIT